MYVVVYFKIVTFQSKEFKNIVYIIESFSNKAHLPQHTFTLSMILQKSCRAKRGIQKRIQCYGSHLELGSPPLASIYVEQDIIKQLPSEARHKEMAFTHCKLGSHLLASISKHPNCNREAVTLDQSLLNRFRAKFTAALLPALELIQLSGICVELDTLKALQPKTLRILELIYSYPGGIWLVAVVIMNSSLIAAF